MKTNDLAKFLNAADAAGHKARQEANLIIPGGKLEFRPSAGFNYGYVFLVKAGKEITKFERVFADRFKAEKFIEELKG